MKALNKIQSRCHIYLRRAQQGFKGQPFCVPTWLPLLCKATYPPHLCLTSFSHLKCQFLLLLLLLSETGSAMTPHLQHTSSFPCSSLPSYSIFHFASLSYFSLPLPGFHLPSCHSPSPTPPTPRPHLSLSSQSPSLPLFLHRALASLPHRQPNWAFCLRQGPH